MPSASGQAARLAIAHLAVFAVLNLAFYFLSDGYFDSHRQIVGGASLSSFSPEARTHIRLAFAVSAAIVTLVNFAVALYRRPLGHALAAVLGLGNFAGGIAAITNHLPVALIATLLVSGAVMPVLAWFSYRRPGSRPAWAFLGTMCSVFALVSLFGAPRLRGILDVSLWTTMTLPGLYVVAAMAFYFLRDDYVDRAPVTA